MEKETFDRVLEEMRLRLDLTRIKLTDVIQAVGDITRKNVVVCLKEVSPVEFLEIFDFFN